MLMNIYLIMIVNLDMCQFTQLAVWYELWGED